MCISNLFDMLTAYDLDRFVKGGEKKEKKCIFPTKDFSTINPIYASDFPRDFAALPLNLLLLDDLCKC